MARWSKVIPIVLVILLIFLFTGYRFTALNAAKSNPSVSSDFELVEEYDTDSSVIFLFRSDEKQEYRTVLSEKSGLLYRSGFSTYIPYSTDTIQTVGGMSYKNNNEELSILIIESNDDEVAYIEAGVGSNLERKEINKGERISFLFPFSKQIDSLNATAFNDDGKKLYYYGYPEDTNIFKPEDLKWHKVE